MIDFFESFVHVVIWSTIRETITLAAKRNKKLQHLDIKRAFFNNVLDKEF